jgi:tRNA dimethylallyltransferase
MDIGTAKIKAEEMRGIAHHLIDIVNPDIRFSAGEFSRTADSKVSEIRARKKIPVIVGGTGLYLRAWLYGLFPTPARSKSIRERMHLLEKKDGLRALHRLFHRIDKETAAKIKEKDRQRIHRAIEIFLVSGRPPSFHRMTRGFGNERYPVIKIGLTFNPREKLYERIEHRVMKMLEEGWIEEVKRLMEDYSPDLHPFKALGYSEIARYLVGDWDYNKMVEEIKKSTRHYAKRQITWFNKENDVKWYDADKDKNLVCSDVLKYIKSVIQSGKG